MGLGFGVWGLGLRVWGLGFRVCVYIGYMGCMNLDSVTIMGI